MQTLPAEVLIAIGQFLAPADLGRLAKTSSRFMRLAQDEHLFHALYQRDFAKLITDKPLDMVTALQGVKPNKQHWIRRKLLAIDSATTEGGQADLKRMKNLKLEADWKWRHLYITLYLTRLNIIENMAEKSGRAASSSFSHRAGTADYRALSYTIFDPELLNDTHTSLLHHNSGVSLVHHSASIKFAPVTSRFTAVRLKHFNLFHQLALTDEELGRRDEDLEDMMDEEDLVYGRGPPDSRIVLCHEGVALWNKDEELYKLVYPIIAIRQIFIDCNLENEIKTAELQEAVREYLLEAPSISCEILDARVCQHYPSQIFEAIVTKLKEAELALESCELISATELKFNCRRVPVWKYHGEQCIYAENAYNKVSKSHERIECLTPAVVKANPYGLMHKNYCCKHNAEHPRMAKYQKRNRALARTREYLSYLKRLNIKLNQQEILKIGTLKVDVRFQ